MYLQDELQHKATYGHFNSKLFGEATHISPFIAREKQDSDKRKVIKDLFWPVGLVSTTLRIVKTTGKGDSNVEN